MRKLLIALAAAAALAAPTTAFAWGGSHHHGEHHFLGIRAAFFAKAGVNLGDLVFVRNNEGDHVSQSNDQGDNNSQGEDNDNDENGAQPLVAQLSGTGSSFGANTATATGNIVGGNDHQNGHFSISLTTDWAAAQSNTFADNDGDADDGTITIACAPATGTSTLTNGSTTQANLTGKTCSVSRNGETKFSFFGRDTTTDARVFLKEEGTAVNGAQITGGEGFGWHH